MVRRGVDEKGAIGRRIGDEFLSLEKNQEMLMEFFVVVEKATRKWAGLTNSPWYAEVWTRNEQLVEELEMVFVVQKNQKMLMDFRCEKNTRKTHKVSMVGRGVDEK